VDGSIGSGGLGYSGAKSRKVSKYIRKVTHVHKGTKIKYKYLCLLKACLRSLSTEVLYSLHYGMYLLVRGINSTV
jgi:hypothetical protein